ncbi:intermembrane phospholipid transport protein YdbH family protein [Desulfovibrio ferrophilus]|nr:YdbH domain-containing protein [Desulfovibrio ferrophilus]
MNRTIIKYTTTALAVLITLVLLGWFVLLPVVLTGILPGLVNDAQEVVELRSCSVRMVGLSETSLHGVVLSVPGVAELEIGQMDVTYSLAGLRNGRIGDVRIADVRLELAPSLDQPVKTNTPDRAATEGALPALPPLNRIVISSGMLHLPLGQEVHAIPFSLEFTTASDRSGGKLALLAAPMGATLSAKASLQLGAYPGVTPSDAAPGVTMSINLKGLALQQLLPLLSSSSSDLTLHGQTTASADGSYNLSTGKFRLGQFTLSIDSPVILEKGKVLASGQGLQASLHQDAKDGFPFTLEMLPLHGFGASTGLRAQGRVQTGDATSLEADYTLEQHGDEFPVKALLSGALRASQETDNWTASTIGDIQGAFRSGEDKVLMDNATYALNARGRGDDGTLDWGLFLPPQQLTKAGIDLKTEALRASGTLSGSLSSSITGTVQGILPKVRLSSDGIEARADFNLRGTVRALPEPEAAITLIGRNISIKTPQAQVSKGTLTLPLAYPPTKANKGTLSIPVIKAMDRQWGQLQLDVRQDRQSVLLDGAYLGALLPGLRAEISARINPVSIPLFEASAKVDGYALPPGFELVTLTPELTNITGSGTLSAQTKMRYGPSGLVATGQAQITNGIIEDIKRDARISGINASLNMPNLLELQSAPLQRLAFDQVSYKDISINDGHLLFQLNGSKETIIEGVRFRWLGGLIQSLPLRLTPDQTDYELTLYCSDLSITQLLSQLGFAQASGEGKISGKIPVRIKDGQVTFDEAELQSSPEEGGRIMVEQADSLLSGVPPGSPQYVQMKIASEALKSFEYKWAKVTATSEGETLKVQLQLDGQPAENLPFEYSEDYGLVELKTAGQGMKFQGIRLDVNFNLPLDRMLRLRKLFSKEQ